MPRFFLTVLLLLGSVATGLFYLQPEWIRFQKLRGETEILRQISTELDDLVKNRDLLLEAINSITKDDRDRIEKALPKGPHSGDLLVLLENLAAKNRVKLQQLDITIPAGSRRPSETTRLPKQPLPGPSNASEIVPAFSTMPLTLTLAGTYEDFKTILADFENNLRLIDIQDITFGAPAGTGDKNLKQDTNFILRAQTYYQ